MDIMTQRARKLRHEMTDAERLLWYRLRNRQLLGLKFRRQFVIDKYIVDFVCIERKLIIELDGSQHMAQKEYDAQRSRVLSQGGYNIMRFWNNDVIECTDAVIEAILLNSQAQIEMLKL